MATSDLQFYVVAPSRMSTSVCGGHAALNDDLCTYHPSQTPVVAPGPN